MPDRDSYKVTPWTVEGEVDYNKLMQEFGTQAIDSEIIEKLRKYTDDLHPFLKLKYFFSHRDLNWILEKYESGEKFYLYTGRGPSGSVHLGHIMPWIFTKYIQDKFNVELLFQLTDDEKFLYDDSKNMNEINRYVYENILDIIAVGFDPGKTRILIDTKHIKHLYPIALEIAKLITFSTVKAVFGFGNSTNIGMISFPAVQAAPCFLPSKIEGRNVPCLIPAAIDQDPYWRVTRDIAEKMGYYKPAQIHSKFLPGLGKNGKMSSSQPETAIFTTDDPEVIEKKISSSFTGGQPTIELQRKLGANADICPIFWYLRYMFENEKSSDERYVKCKGGDLLCHECKHDLNSAVKPYMKEFQKKRDKAKDKVNEFLFE